MARDLERWGLRRQVKKETTFCEQKVAQKFCFFGPRRFQRRRLKWSESFCAAFFKKRPLWPCAHYVPGTIKLFAREPSTSDQPLMETNSNSLIGSEISVGDTMIMPSDISTEATARSMSTKGT